MSRAHERQGRGRWSQLGAGGGGRAFATARGAAVLFGRRGAAGAVRGRDKARHSSQGRRCRAGYSLCGATGAGASAVGGAGDRLTLGGDAGGVFAGLGGSSWDSRCGRTSTTVATTATRTTTAAFRSPGRTPVRTPTGGRRDGPTSVTWLARALSAARRRSSTAVTVSAPVFWPERQALGSLWTSPHRGTAPAWRRCPLPTCSTST